MSSKPTSGNIGPLLSLAERDRRFDRTRRLLDEKGLDAVLVFGQRGRERYEGYLSNESIEGVVAFFRDAEPVYVSWTHHRLTRRFAANMSDTRFWIDDLRVGPTGPLLISILTERGLAAGRIGVVGLDSKAPGEMHGVIPYRTWEAVLGGLPKAEFVDISMEFSMMMLAKSDEEIALVRYGARLGEEACEAMFETVRPGVRESDVYAAIMDVIYRGGAISVPPQLIISVGADDVGWAPPFWNYAGGESRVIREGDLVQAEIFPCYGGMETQMQMSVALEPVPVVVHELASVARASYERGLEHARAGVAFQALATQMEQPVLADPEHWTVTPLVHSVTPIVVASRIGINIERSPFFDRMPGARTLPALNDITLAPNMALAFEPNVCRGSCRVNIGGTVLVTDGAAEELNSLPTRMQVRG